jgi:hypothetical protein
MKAELSGQSLLAFVDTKFGMLALTGLDHLGLRSGHVLAISGEGPLPPASVVADLGEAPYAFTKDSRGSVIVVLSIAAPGAVETLLATDYGGLYPNSVAVTPSGVIYVGMRHFVTRVTSLGPEFREDWLAPADCPKFETRVVPFTLPDDPPGVTGTQFQCVCANRAGG